jgi:hypothetical protein
MWLSLQAEPGAHLKDEIREGLRLAKQLNITVWCKFNGVNICFRPTDQSPARIQAAYHEAVRLGWSECAAPKE